MVVQAHPPPPAPSKPSPLPDEPKEPFDPRPIRLMNDFVRDILLARLPPPGDPRSAMSRQEPSANVNRRTISGIADLSTAGPSPPAGVPTPVL